VCFAEASKGLAANVCDVKTPSVLPQRHTPHRLGAAAVAVLDPHNGTPRKLRSEFNTPNNSPEITLQSKQAAEQVDDMAKVTHIDTLIDPSGVLLNAENTNGYVHVGKGDIKMIPTPAHTPSSERTDIAQLSAQVMSTARAVSQLQKGNTSTQDDVKKLTETVERLTEALAERDTAPSIQTATAMTATTPTETPSVTPVLFPMHSHTGTGDQPARASPTQVHHPPEASIPLTHHPSAAKEMKKQEAGVQPHPPTAPTAKATKSYRAAVLASRQK
jgi:hypothetical protein